MVRVCEASDLASVGERFAALAVREEADGTLVLEDPEYGTVRFRADGVISFRPRSAPHRPRSLRPRGPTNSSL